MPSRGTSNVSCPFTSHFGKEKRSALISNISQHASKHTAKLLPKSSMRMTLGHIKIAAPYDVGTPATITPHNPNHLPNPRTSITPAPASRSPLHTTSALPRASAHPTTDSTSHSAGIQPVVHARHRSCTSGRRKAYRRFRKVTAGVA